MTAEEMLYKGLKSGEYEDITCNPEIDIKAPFYQAIVRAMETYASLKVAEMPREEEIRNQSELKFVNEIHQAIWISGCKWFRNRMSKPNNCRGWADLDDEIDK